jgi:hypothetical protein
MDAGYMLNPDKFSLWVLELKLMSLTGRLRTDE